MTAPKRWPLWAPFVAAALLLLLWFVVWRAGADRMRAELAAFAAEQSAAGGAVTHAPMRARGFPFFLRGEADGFSLARGRYALEAETLYIHASPFDLSRIVFSVDPALRLATPGGVWTIRAEGARASIEAAAAGWLFKAEAASLSGVNGAAVVETGRGVVNVAPEGADAYKVSFRVLGASLKNARGEAAMARLDAALTAAGDPLTLNIHGLDADIGPARVGLLGAVRAGDDGRLAGRLDASVENPAALAGALGVVGALKAEDAARVEAGLALLGAAGGGRIAAPLEFAEGEARLAGVRIGKSPRVGQP